MLVRLTDDCRRLADSPTHQRFKTKEEDKRTGRANETNKPLAQSTRNLWKLADMAYVNGNIRATEQDMSMATSELLNRTVRG